MDTWRHAKKGKVKVESQTGKHVTSATLVFNSMNSKEKSNSNRENATKVSIGITKVTLGWLNLNHLNPCNLDVLCKLSQKLWGRANRGMAGMPVEFYFFLLWRSINQSSLYLTLPAYHLSVCVSLINRLSRYEDDANEAKAD